jgi:hypothetical protein
MNINELTIGQAREIANMFSVSPAMQNIAVENHGLQIVVLDRGFVYIGFVRTNGRWLYIENAQNIRVWGTTRGLGELVDGPTPTTKIDAVGDVKAGMHAVVHMIAADSVKWTKFF